VVRSDANHHLVSLMLSTPPPPCKAVFHSSRNLPHQWAKITPIDQSRSLNIYPCTSIFTAIHTLNTVLCASSLYYSAFPLKNLKTTRMNRIPRPRPLRCLMILRVDAHCVCFSCTKRSIQMRRILLPSRKLQALPRPLRSGTYRELQNNTN